METEKQRMPQASPAVEYTCCRFEEKDFLAFLRDEMPDPLAEAFENHIEACDECAIRLGEYDEWLRLWQPNPSTGENNAEG